MSLALIEGVVANAVTSGTAGVTTQDFVVSGFTETPKAAKIICSTATGTAGVAIAHGSMCMGLTDGTNEAGVWVSDQNNQATTNTSRGAFDTGIIRIYNAAGTVTVAEGSVDSLITGGIRILWDKIPLVAIEVHVVLWFGENVTVKVEAVTPSDQASGSVQIATGFEPDHVITLSSNTLFDETIYANANIQVAHTVRDGGTTAKTRFTSHHANDNKSTSESGMLISNTTAIAINHSLTGTSFPTISNTNLDDFHSTDGFNVSTTGGTGTTIGPSFVYLAVSYGGNQYALKGYRTPTTTGVDNLASGFKVWSAMSLQTRLVDATFTGSETNANAAPKSFGLLTNSGVEWSNIFRSRDGSATSDVDCASDVQFMALQNNTGASFTFIGTGSFHATDGIDINYTRVNATQRMNAIFMLEVDVISGSSASVLPLATAAGTGTEAFVGTGTSTLPLATAAGTGVVVNPTTGTGQGVLPLATGTGSGTVRFTAIGVGVLPLATGTGAGILVFIGTSSGTLPLAIGTGTGSVVDTLTGSGAGVLPLATATGTGQLTLAGTGQGVLPLATGTGSGNVLDTITGTGTGTLPLVAGIGVGELVFTGAGFFRAAVPKLVGTGLAELQFIGSSSGSLPLPESSGVGQVLTSVIGTGAGTLPLATGTGTGTQVFTGSSSGVLPLATGTGTGTTTAVGTIGSGAGLLPLPEATGTGAVGYIGTGAGTLPLATGTGTAELVFTGAGTGTFPLATASGTGRLVFVGESVGLLPLAQSTGLGILTFPGTGEGSLPLGIGTGSGLLRFISTGAGILPLPLATGVGITGDQLGCIIDLEGSFCLITDLQGSYLSTTDLEGIYMTHTDMEGQYALTKDLEGSYTNIIDLEGDVC